MDEIFCCESQINVPGITVQSVSPPTFTVRVAPKEEKFVDVIPALKGKPPKGYRLNKKGVEISPIKVKIWGVKEDVDKVDKLTTIAIDLSRINRETKIDAAILPPKSGRVFVGAKHVQVTLPVEPVMGKRKFTKVSIQVKNCPQGYECDIRPKSAKVLLNGPEPTLMDLDSGKFASGLYVDAAEFDPAQSLTYRGVSPTCDRPASVTCRVRPRSVTLKLTKLQNSPKPTVPANRNQKVVQPPKQPQKVNK